ncbi:MAG: coproporphyrinogen III oxidase family protein [Oligoflexia bacterium]|nr:coproporphyrinogen III oxidase family protein [Oligoflexia bacterium]
MKPVESIYLHFPFCRHRCNYCDFFKQVPEDKDQSFTSFESQFLESFDVHKKFLADYDYQFMPLKTLYIGGGTPSLWGSRGAEFLADLFAKEGVTFDKDCEFTLEVNPGTWTEESLQSWIDIGVNRFSLGVQSLDSRFMKALDRVHSLNDALNTIEFFSQKKWNYSVDFMLGLPYSVEWNRDIEKELNEILKFSPNHLSLYILTVKENYPHFDKLPDDEFISREYLKVSDILASKGMHHYEVSNFSKPGLESKHNLRYWESLTVGAIGPSATGFLFEDKIRYKWKTKSSEFETEVLTEEEYQLEKVYMKLRTNLLLDSKELDIDDEILRKWSELSYIKHVSTAKFQVTSQGFLMLDSMMGDLFKE